jgi:hypothetical protein
VAIHTIIEFNKNRVYLWTYFITVMHQ